MLGQTVSGIGMVPYHFTNKNSLMRVVFSTSATKIQQSKQDTPNTCAIVFMLAPRCATAANRKLENEKVNQFGQFRLDFHPRYLPKESKI